MHISSVVCAKAILIVMTSDLDAWCASTILRYIIGPSNIYEVRPAMLSECRTGFD